MITYLGKIDSHNLGVAETPTSSNDTSALDLDSDRVLPVVYATLNRYVRFCYVIYAISIGRRASPFCPRVPPSHRGSSTGFLPATDPETMGLTSNPNTTIKLLHSHS